MTTYSLPYSFYGQVREGILCQDPEVILEGPSDCIGGETEVFVPGRGTVAVETLYQEQAKFLVLTMNGYAVADAPFIKGEAELYRITTQSGRSFTATESHRVFTARGWIYVSDLVAGEWLPECAPCLAASSWARSRPAYQLDGHRCSDTALDCQYHCSDYHRQCDARLLPTSDSGRCGVPSLGGVHERSRDGWHEDDWANESVSRRPCLSPDHRASWGYSDQIGQRADNQYRIVPRILLPGGGSFLRAARFQKERNLLGLIARPDRSCQDRRNGGSPSFQCRVSSNDGTRAECLGRGGQPLCGYFAFHHTLGISGQFPIQSDVCSRLPCVSPPKSYYTIQWTRLSSVSFERVGLFYDLRVPGAGHYLAEGLWHHNTGKTLGLLTKCCILAIDNPGAQIAVIRKVKADLASTALLTLERDLLPHLPFVEVYGGRAPQRYLFPAGSTFWIGGLDDPGKTLSAERDIVYVVQAEQLSLSDWEYLTRTTSGRGAVMPYTQLIGCCNPAHPSHWILQRQRAGHLRVFKTTHRDNPQLFDPATGDVTPEGRKRLDVLRKLTGSRLLRLYHGLWAAPEGAIYDVFDEEKHVVASFNIPSHWPRAVGIDPAGAHRAAVWLAWDPDAQMLNAYRELLMPFGVTVGGFVEQVKALSRNEPVFIWVCGAKSERDWRTEFAAAGLPVTEPPVTDVWIGIDRVYQLLRDFQLVVHDTCPALISEIGGYSRVQGRDGYFTDRIANKEQYHILDGLRYVMAWLTEPHERAQLVYAPVRIGPQW